MSLVNEQELTSKMERGIAEQIRPLAEPIANAYGLELILIEWLSERGRMVLRLYLDANPQSSPSDGKDEEQATRGITVETCAAFSRELSPILDVEETIPANYELEVSSPGLNRPLTRIHHFRQHLGSKVKLKTDRPVTGNQCKFSGRLVDVDGADIVVQDTNKVTWRVPFADLVKANLEYEFDSGA